MPKGDADTKAARQARLQRLFTAQPGRSWGAAELSGELGVTVRTVQRDIAELGSNGRLPLAEEGDGPTLRYRLMEDEQHGGMAAEDASHLPSPLGGHCKTFRHAMGLLRWWHDSVKRSVACD